MNSNMGLLPPAKGNKRERKARKAKRATESLESYLNENRIFTD